ncbi:Thioesterase/thiol ester dehydrase-isomerase [Panus rudis PR-1116 ss-1]|nr:Thioesterase/thiol ester dehydrase-isomerase [Panus rudis PR-1116 ss-1]
MTQKSRFPLGYRLSTSSSSPANGRSLYRYLRLASAASGLAAASYTFGSLYPPTLATYISPRMAPPPPHPESDEAKAYTEALENALQQLPVLEQHRKLPDADDWYETRPFAHLPEERRVHSLTAGALRGPGKLAVPPIVRAKKDESENVIFVHVGRSVCGHEGIVHGGLLATLLDESLGRIALLNLPEKIGVTANLNLNYRAPTRADQFLVIKTHKVEQSGRKVTVAGRIEDVDGNLLVDATALFIQPKYAQLLNTKQIREVLGEPPNSKEPITEGAVAPISMPPANGVESKES